MPALNFSKQFADLVESGAKGQTIRETRKQPIKPGDTLYLYTGQRTKSCRKLMDAVCTSVKPITLRWGQKLHTAPIYNCGEKTNLVYQFRNAEVDVDGQRLTDAAVEQLARADGFTSEVSFLSWFCGEMEPKPRKAFRGHLIKWVPLTPGMKDRLDEWFTDAEERAAGQLLLAEFVEQGARDIKDAPGVPATVNAIVKYGAVDDGLRRYGLGSTQAYLLPQQSGGQLRPVDEPAPTVSTSGAISLILEYYGNGSARPVSEPLPTVTCNDRFALIRAAGGDVMMRMLKPAELAAAQGFPPDYRFVGTQKDVTRQIGNAVPCGLARALVLAVMSQSNDISQWTASGEEGAA
ncbi:MAG: hypothetical protein E1N59_2865 [Puniceicoccaceae bacterium 5H]|nr:MAG: hypothetical protein E1N59_2865 [Puniceicoccaceae bacterium 5H]